MHPLFYDPSQEEEEDSVVSDDRHVRDVHLGEEIVPSAARSLAYSPPVFIFPISVVAPVPSLANRWKANFTPNVSGKLLCKLLFLLLLLLLLLAYFRCPYGDNSENK